MLRPSPSLAAYQSTPAGTFTTGKHFLCLCENEELYACFLWGKPRGEETRALVSALATEMRPAAVPHRTYVDFSALTSIDAEAFAVLRDFLEGIKPRQQEVTVREAVIRPGGLVGAVVAGFFTLYPQPYPTAVFTEPAEGAAYLDVDEALLRRWEVLRDEVRGTPPELRQLRQVLQSHLEDIDLPRAAKLVAVSTRTLQRRLGQHATTFQRELDAARLDVAISLVGETSDKFSAIATRIGFGSYQHFSDWFRRKVGCTAEAWRRRALSPSGPASPEE